MWLVATVLKQYSLGGGITKTNDWNFKRFELHFSNMSFGTTVAV